MGEKIKYYKRKYEKYYDNESNILSECGLKGVDIDDNFHIINGEHIKAIKFTNEKSKLQLIKNNGELLECAFKLKEIYDDENNSCVIQLIGSFYSDDNKEIFEDIVLSNIDVSKLVNIYEPGEGLLLKDNVFSLDFNIIKNFNKENLNKNDVLLSYDDNDILNSTITYTREELEGVDSLVLKGKNGVIIGSVPVAEFIADGMLESVEPKEEGSNIFIFTFNSATGNKTFEVDLSKFVDLYYADNDTMELIKDDNRNIFKVIKIDAGSY